MTGDNVSYLLRHLRQLAVRAEGDLTDGELLARFCRRGEETAFGLLVQRHGPMVLSVCRRVAENADDADDAFQATFFVLARKAASIRKQSSLASWLYGVARRVAAQARARAARRRTQERRSLPMPRPEPCDELTWQELRGVLDDELGRLPDKYRAAVVLCYLEGKSQEQAARELGCPRTSLSSRLARARELLHERLVRRGIALSAAALAGALTEKAAAVPLPALLTLETVRTATLAQAGVSASVAALAKGGMKSMLATTTKLGGVLLLGVSVLMAVGYLLAMPGPNPPPLAPAAEPVAQAQPPAKEAPKAAEGPAAAGAHAFSGVVVDAADKPVGDADVWLMTGAVADGRPETLDRARTDAAGRFQLTLPARWSDTTHALRQDLGLVAAKPGARVAVIGFSRSSVPPATGARLVLAPAAEAAVQVLAPDGKPVPGARVEVQALAGDQIRTDITEEYARDMGEQFKVKARATPLGFAVGRASVPLPEELSRRLSARADDKGTATLPGVTRADVGGVRVTADGFGTQSLALNHDARFSKRDGPPAEFPAAVTLQPVGRLSGRLTAKSADATRGVKVVIMSVDQPGAGESPEVYRFGSAEVAAGADGTFEVAALARGFLRIHLLYPPGATVRARESADVVQVKAGERTQVNIVLEPAVRISGVVRERGTGRPVPGVGVLIGSGNTLEPVTTDAQGRYTCLVAPGEIYRMPQVPRQFLSPGRAEARSLTVEVPAGAAEREVSPIEVSRAVALRGAVMDDGGKPAAGAVVRAAWWGPNPQFTGADNWANEKSLTADERGEFTLEGLAPGAQVRLTARRGEAQTRKATEARPDPDRPVTLRVTREAALALAGRVLDTAGKPVAGARVEVWARPWAPPPNTGTPRRVALEDAVRTDAAGKFRTPAGLEPDGDYRVAVTADGFDPARSGWLAVAAERPLAFPDVVLRRLRTVSGRVLDRQDKPVAGARVLVIDEARRLTATADADGRFRLEGVHEGPAFLFADGAGFRFAGQTLPAADRPLDLVLTRTGEPAEKALGTLAPALPRKERLALAARVLEPALAVKDESSRARALEVLARIDPPQVLERIGKKAVKDAWLQDYLRRAVVQALAGDSFDEARAVVEAMHDPGWRATAYRDLADALPGDKKPQKREMLAQALLQARAMQDASHRVIELAEVAKRLRQLGEAGRADKLLREAEPAARELPSADWAGYARAAFAEELAVIDLTAALALVKDLKDPFEHDRHHGNIAHKLAALRPADAERVLGLTHAPGESMQRGNGPPAVSFARDQYAVRVCYRMAAADRERAERIAGRITDPGNRAQAYGVMALALARAKPAQAADLLRRAFGVLDDHVRAGKDQARSLIPVTAVAAALLPAAEEIDPQLVAEFFWRTLSLRAPQPPEDPDVPAPDEPDLSLALLLARYDRTAARTLLEPLVARKATLLQYGRGRTLLPALAAVDPKWAVQVFDGLPASSQKDAERTTLARALVLDGEARWRDAHRQIGLWFVDDEDL